MTETRLMPQPTSKSKPTHATNQKQDFPARIAAGLAKLALVFRHEAWMASGQHGLTPTQAQILAAIAGATEPIGIKYLSEQLAITMGTVSAAVTTLVEKNLVRKRQSDQDARAITLSLTRKGAQHVSSAAEWPETMLLSAASLPARDQAGLVRGLSGLIRALQERGAVPMQRMCVSCQFFRPNEYPECDKAHHCSYINAPIGDADLRFDCREMQPVRDHTPERLWHVFVQGEPLDDQGPGHAARVAPSTRTA